MTGARSDADGLWKAVGEAADGVATALSEASLATDYDDELLVAARAELPPKLPDACSVVIGAIARPVTQATLVVDGVEHTFVVPPHYAGYDEIPRRFAAIVADTLAAHGRPAAQARVPLKTLAAGSGLALYGRNNIAYVEGLGSYLQLAACATDLPAPPEAEWTEARALAACEGCTTCARACPTGAITGERFTLQTGRCLTAVNEDDAPFPAWVDPAWHTCAVGCLRCQQACPENAGVTLRVEEPVRFDERESAAILAGDGSALHDGDIAARRAACGIDYDAALIARNLRLLLPR